MPPLSITFQSCTCIFYLSFHFSHTPLNNDRDITHVCLTKTPLRQLSLSPPSIFTHASYKKPQLLSTTAYLKHSEVYIRPFLLLLHCKHCIFEYPKYLINTGSFFICQHSFCLSLVRTYLLQNISEKQDHSPHHLIWQSL